MDLDFWLVLERKTPFQSKISSDRLKIFGIILEKEQEMWQYVTNAPEGPL